MIDKENLNKDMAAAYKRDIKEIPNLKILVDYGDKKKDRYIESFMLSDVVKNMDKQLDLKDNNDLIKKIEYILLHKSINFETDNKIKVILPDYDVFYLSMPQATKTEILKK